MEELRTEMDELTKQDKRVAVLSETGEAFENIASFISGVQNKQRQNVMTLRKLEALIRYDYCLIMNELLVTII